MANTLASATLDLARLIGDVVDGVATSNGTTTTLVDSSFGKRDYSGAFPSADYYNYGTIWFVDNSTAALEGTTAIITDFAASTSCTFTYDATGTSATNDKYAVMESIWPRYKLRAFVNLALQGIRAMPALDTSLTTTANTETLNLPTDVYNVRHIQIAKSLNSPYYFSDYWDKYWEEKNSKIYFKTGYWPQSTGYTVRLWYQATHTNLTNDTSGISTYIDPQWLSWEAVVHAYRWRRPLLEGGKVDELAITEAHNNARSYRRRYAELLPKLPMKVKLANWLGDEHESPEYDGYVRV